MAVRGWIHVLLTRHGHHLILLHVVLLLVCATDHALAAAADVTAAPGLEADRAIGGLFCNT